MALPALVETVEPFEPEVLRDAYCNWLLSRAVHRDGYRIVLAGEDADELFAGYPLLEFGFAHGEAVGRSLRGRTLKPRFAKSSAMTLTADPHPPHHQSPICERFAISSALILPIRVIRNRE